MDLISGLADSLISKAPSSSNSTQEKRSVDLFKDFYAFLALFQKSLDLKEAERKTRPLRQEKTSGIARLSKWRMAEMGMILS